MSVYEARYPISRGRSCMVWGWRSFALVGLFALYGPTFSFAGQLRYVEAALIGLALVRFNRLPFGLRAVEWRLLGLFALCAGAQALSGIVNSAPTSMVVARTGTYLILVVLLLALFDLSQFRPQRVVAIVFGYCLSYFFILFVGSAAIERYAEVPWQFGLGMALTVMLAGSFTFKPRLLPLAPLLLLAMAGAHLYMGSRSLGAISMLAAGLSFLAINMGRDMPGRFRITQVAAVAAILVAGAVAGMTFLTKAADSNLLPMQLAEKVQMQAAHSKGMLVAARPDTFTALHAIGNRPLFGYGPGVFDPDIFAWYSDVVTEMYTGGRNYEQFYETMFASDWNNGIPSHSHVFGAWVDAGILAALCWFFVFGLACYVLVRSLWFRSPWSPLYILISLLTMWDVPFSPGPHRMDMAVHLLVLFSALRHFRIAEANAGYGLFMRGSQAFVPSRNLMHRVR